MTSEQRPSRVVDAEHVGWWLVGPGPDGAAGYVNSETYVSGGAPVALDDLPGPVRPVLPCSDVDRDAMFAAFALAGRRAAYTLAVAVYQVRDVLYRRYPVDTMEQRRYAIDRSKAQLRAGRPGSWEAARLWELSLWPDPGKTRRVHPEALAAMRGVILRWVTDPARYTEVAETLASLVSGYADAHDGWAGFADQWLQPGALDHEGLILLYSLFYSLFYSLSERFDPDVLA